MAEPRVTEAKLRALRAIDEGLVSWYTPWRGTRNRFTVVGGSGTSVPSVQRAVDRRLAQVGPKRNALYCSVVLTDAGRSVLAAHNRGEGR
jgi:hypothetical protein